MKKVIGSTVSVSLVLLIMNADKISNVINYADSGTLAVYGVVICSIILLIVGIVNLCINPFSYPYFEYIFDVSNKKNVDLLNEIDKFINSGKFTQIEKHKEIIQNWKSECEDKVSHCIFKKIRYNQYQSVIDDENAYVFFESRQQTRYKQQNYVRTSYKVSQIVNDVSVNYTFLLDRYNQLYQIGFEATLKDYNTKFQRKLMTPELRRKIWERDNYTCQICGKYMPDTVGLQVDHIIPVDKGGKSVPSNLQVLCSVCNGRKSNK